MGISHSTARWAAPASFLFDFAAQQYGIFSKPNMQDIHYQNLAAFSPRPEFIGGFFFPQQIAQLWWLYRLWSLTGEQAREKRRVSGLKGEEEEVRQMVDYVPFYVAGNVCIGTWMFFWNSNDLKTANIFVIINTFSQLFYLMTRMKPMNLKSTNSILTHVVAKTFAGIGVLDLLHNTSAAYFKDVAPNHITKALTGLGFAGLATFSDWIFGGCLVYDLIALAVGQSNTGTWGKLLGAYAAMTAGIVGLKNYIASPYVSYDPRYDELNYDDGEV